MTAFLRKERGETLHTWRIWVLPAILLFIGVTSPVMTVLLPAIVKWAARSDPGTQIIVGRPTAAAVSAVSRQPAATRTSRSSSPPAAPLQRGVRSGTAARS